VSLPSRPPAPPGWYPDTTRPGTQRYFDGVAWTAHTAPLPTTNRFGLPAAPHDWASESHLSSGPGSGTSPTDPIHWLVPIGRTWQSIAAGYVALFALAIWPLGPLALGLGIAALRASARGKGRGRGRAYFAIAVGSLAILGMIAVLVVRL
jgi:hypothetical protein